MDFEKWLEIFKQAWDTRTAVVIITAIGFYLGTRVQKKIGEFATKKEFEAHRKLIYDGNLVLEGTISSNMQKFHSDLKEHQEKDDARFKALDAAWLPQLAIMGKQLISARLSLSRIEGHLKIDGGDQE